MGAHPACNRRFVLEIAPRISVDLDVRSGRPVVRGTRVPIDAVLGHLAAGRTVEQVAGDYGIERDDVLAVLAYAAHALAGHTQTSPPTLNPPRSRPPLPRRR